MTEKKIFNKDGIPIAYNTSGYTPVIYLWDGIPVAYIYDEVHVYGINGRHLGWFVNDIFYTNAGERIGFMFDTCPVSIAKDPVKGKKHPRDELKPRWEAPSPPKFAYKEADQDLKAFFADGQINYYPEGLSTKETSSEESTD